MNEQTPPKLAKWPFFFGDALLLAVAALVFYRQSPSLNATSIFMVAGCVVIGAWLGVTPFLVEYRGRLKFAEAHQLAATIDQIKNLQGIADQISVSTAQWQIIQEHSEKSVAAANQMGERMAAEAKAFGEFMQKANDTEKAHLRVEVDKFRRNEAEWMQIVVRLLDHGHALHQASVRFGHPAVVEQLGKFQNACRDIVRRVGLVPFFVNDGEAFDRERHQFIEAEAPVPDGSRVDQTIAAGYQFQGHILRRALVTLKPTESDQVSSEISAGVTSPFERREGAAAPDA
jgi:molecular chaperone GrpE (heat shock protein)